jgi:hypothetical protein
MKFFNTNILAAGIGSVIIASFALLFYTDITKKADAGESELIGTITFKRKVAHRKYASQVVWEEVEQNEKIYNYDSIRTADLSEAIIHLKDGTEIDLNENSMILLALSRDEIDLKFTQGSIYAKRDELKDNAKKLSINALGTTVVVGKSNVNLSRHEGTDLNLTVNSGNATIKAGEAERLVKADQKVVVSKDKREVKVLTLNLRPTSPPPNGYFITTSNSKTIDFSWKPVRGQSDVNLEIASDNQFNNIITQKSVSRNATALTLQRGIYYWRLRAINREREVEYSEVRRLSIIRDMPAVLISPQDGMKYTYWAVPPLIKFKWSESDIASSYVLIISKDQVMKNIIKRVQTPNNNIAIDVLEQGTYFWRVDTITGLREASNLKSTVHKLTIDVKKEIEPPKLLYPPDNNHISRKILENHHITFTWEKNPEMDSFHLSIARDRDFKSILFTSESRVNFLQFKEILPIGEYHWRVTGKLKGGEMTNPSLARNLVIMESQPLQLIMPEDNAIIEPSGSEMRSSVKFAWARTDVQGKFHLEISRNENFTSIYKKHDGDNHSANIDDIESGSYFWRVSLLGDDGSPIMRSSPRMLLIQEKLLIPDVISPRSGSVVNMRDRNSFALRWRKTRGATLYQIGLHRMKRGRTYSILQKTISETNYKVDTLSRLDEGTFFWTLQALETKEGSSRVIARSPTVKTYFEITLGKPVGRVKLKLPKTLYPE